MRPAPPAVKPCFGANTDEAALNWHNDLIDKCALKQIPIVFVPIVQDELLPSEALACISFLESTAVRAHMPKMTSTPVQTYVAILKDDDRYGPRRDHAVLAYRPAQP